MKRSGPTRSKQESRKKSKQKYWKLQYDFRETVKYYFLDFVWKGRQNFVAFFDQEIVFLWEKNTILQTDMEFIKEKSATALLEPKNYAKNGYFAILANLRQKCVKALKWDLTNEKHLFFILCCLFQHITYSILNYAESAYNTQEVHQFSRRFLKALRHQETISQPPVVTVATNSRSGCKWGEGG